MTPTLKRGQYVSADHALYMRDGEHRERVEPGAVGIIQDFSSHPWVGVYRIFIAKVRYPDGKVVRVNERALRLMKPGPSKYHPFEVA